MLIFIPEKWKMPFLLGWSLVFLSLKPPHFCNPTPEPLLCGWCASTPCLFNVSSLTSAQIYNVIICVNKATSGTETGWNFSVKDDKCRISPIQFFYINNWNLWLRFFFSYWSMKISVLKFSVTNVVIQMLTNLFFPLLSMCYCNTIFVLVTG